MNKDIKTIGIVRQMVADGQISQEVAEKYFPELKVSEDEKIRKWLIGVIKSNEYGNISNVGEMPCPKPNVIAWLEKRCETFTKKDVDDAYLKGVCDTKQELEKQGEQKLADKAKVEHLIPQKGMYYTCIKDYYSSNNTYLYVKGKVYKSFFNGYIDDESHFGLSWTNSCTEKYFEPTKDEDWIVCEHDNVIGKPMQYKEFKKKINQKFIENLKAKGITPSLRLWTIQDAKDGDALCYKDEISLYKHNIKNCTKQEITFGGFVYHCCYDGKRFIMDSLYSLTEQDKMNIHPATKEQRDTLFQRMHEAGYEWDEDKLELKKIENEIPFGAKDSELQEVTYFIPKGFHAEIDDDKVVIKKGEKPTAWSEEDEEIINKISIAIATLYSCSTAVKVEKWLKSLKERVDKFDDGFKVGFSAAKYNQWNPSDAQIASLTIACDRNDRIGFDLTQLLRDLKKLKE